MLTTPLALFYPCRYLAKLTQSTDWITPKLLRLACVFIVKEIYLMGSDVNQLASIDLQAVAQVTLLTS